MTEEPEKRPELDDLEKVLEHEPETLDAFLEDVHPADLAEWAADLGPAATAKVLDVLDAEGRSELLKFAEDHVREDLLGQLSIDQIVEVVEELPADEVVDLLALTDDARTEKVLRAVDFERAQGLRKLARYDEDTAGGMMTVDYVAVDADAHVGDAIKLLKTEIGPAAEEAGGVFVIDPEGKPIGYVTDRDLLTTPIHTPVSEVMETDLISVNASDDREEVAHLVHKYSFDAVPVVDMRGALIGVISDEDALDVLQEEAEEDILRLVGTSPSEQQTRMPILARLRHRLPLQALTVCGGLATAHMLSVFMNDDANQELRYLPIVIGLAGNVGIQSSTILVRAFATGELSTDRASAVLREEVTVGLVIGIICGVTTMLVAATTEAGNMSHPVEFGVAVGAAITAAVTWAACVGCLVPLSCQRWGIDPAVVAGPFLITLSDISGTAIFIAVTKLMLTL